METTKLYTLKKNDTDFPKVKITSSYEAQKFIRNFYADDIEIYESFFLLLLDRANNTIGYSKISQGGICGTVVDIKIVCKYVVDSLASGIILAHNHPSGNTLPSSNDVEITKKIKEALSFLDSSVLDHIILTREEFYSFADKGLM